MKVANTAGYYININQDILCGILHHKQKDKIKIREYREKVIEFDKDE